MPKKRKGGKGKGRSAQATEPAVTKTAQKRDELLEVGEPSSSDQQPGPSGTEDEPTGQHQRETSYLPQPVSEDVEPDQIVGASAEVYCRSDIEQLEEAPQTATAQLSEMLSEMSVILEPKNLPMAPRKSKGICGHRIELIANYFILGFKNIPIYHYDIEILPIQTDSKHRRVKKGKSLLDEGRTAKEATEKGESHAEHEKNRSPGKQRCQQIIAKMCDSHELAAYHPVYDRQKNLYTAKMLPVKDKKKQESKYRIQLEEDGRTKEFEITVKPVKKKGGGNEISLGLLKDIYEGTYDNIKDSQEAIMALDTIMCHRSPPITQIQVGRSYLRSDRGNRPLGGGLELLFGYNQSVRLTQRGPAVVVNFAAKAFFKPQTVIECANQILTGNSRNSVDITKVPWPLSKDELEKLSKALEKVQVETNHQNHPRKYYIQAVVRESAKTERVGETGKTIADYFKEKYPKRPLRFPHLPLLHMRSSANTTFMPMEVCRIIRQPKLTTFSGDVTSKMITETAIPPKRRFNKILESVQQIDDISRPLMNNYNLQIERDGRSGEIECMEIPGRVLDAPQLEYSSSRGPPLTIKPNVRGAWMLTHQEQFFKPVTGNCPWMLISFESESECEMRVLEQFVDKLCRFSHEYGMNLPRPKGIDIFCKGEDTRAVFKYAKDSKVRLVVIVLPTKRDRVTYEGIKYEGEMVSRMLTQCIKSEVLVKLKSQVVYNLLLKINTKLGGVNHKLLHKQSMFNRPIIIIGADAAHPARGSNSASVAAVVGSLDEHPSRYAVTCRVQQNPDEERVAQEIITDLENMVREILRAFMKELEKKYKKIIKPEKIIFFRDGVSEGQFQTVLENEVEAVKNACREELGDCLPPLTFLVVQKRHQTRFRPKYQEDAICKKDLRTGEIVPGNIPPGTTVDTDVVHPIYFDYFLASHEGIQGTTKPAHYTVILDENNLSSDDLQRLCYNLCHLYARCNRSISIPAPVMYADLACTRAKDYLDFYIRKNKIVRLPGRPLVLPEEIINYIANMKDFEHLMSYI